MMSRITILLLLALATLLLLMAGSVGAMFSDNYRLDWFTPLTSGGGGAADSTNYVINLTVGQTAIGASSSASYNVGLGYWYGAVAQYKVFLPIVLRQ